MLSLETVPSGLAEEDARVNPTRAMSIKSIHIVPAISEEASGVARAVLDLVDALGVEEQKAQIAALAWRASFIAPPSAKTFRIGLGPRRLGRSPEMREWLDRIAQSRTVDLFHNHGIWMMPNVYPGIIAGRYDLPYVVSPHGAFSTWALKHGSIAKWLFWPLVQKPSLRVTSLFHATSLAEYREIRSLGFVQPVAVVPLGISVPQARPKRTQEKRTLLFLGRIHPKKGIDILLRSWKSVQDKFPEWQILIVGPDNGGYLATMRQLCSELGLKRVEFAGPKYNEHKWNAYRDAELFVLPTHSENFGIAVAESLAAGTPAIVSKGAPWEGLVGNQAGWWIEVGIDPLIACLESTLSQSPAELAAYGSRGRTWVEREFSWKQTAKKMTAAYGWLLDGGAKPPWILHG